jgi:hypothetical protein
MMKSRTVDAPIAIIPSAILSNGSEPPNLSNAATSSALPHRQAKAAAPAAAALPAPPAETKRILSSTGLHRSQETEQRLIGWAGAFGLDPMAGTFDDNFAAQVRDPLIHRGEESAAPEGKHNVF